MAQATQSSIIDLTGGDDNDDSIARAQAAYEKASAAAFRLSHHFESLKTSKSIVHQNPRETADLTRKDSPSATSHKKKTLPPLGTFTKPGRSEKDGLKNDEENDAIPRPNSSLSSPGVSAARSALGTAASRPVGYPSIVERTGVKKQRPRQTTSVTPTTNAFSSRTPRSAAISAKQNIAEACNKLEKWTNRDPDLIPQQAGVSTPRRLGRPNDDLDEWSPTSNIRGEEEEQKELGRIITDSPTPSGGKCDSLAASRDSSLSQTQVISTSQHAKKRKFSGSSQSRGSPVKVARLDEAPSAHYKSNPPSLEHFHNGTDKNNSAGVYERWVHPAIQAAKAEYKQSLTEDELTSIGKSITNDIMEQGLEAFCPASANCLNFQRTAFILKFVSRILHERALRLRRGGPINSIASAEFSPKEMGTPLFDRDFETSRLDGDAPSEVTVKTGDKSPLDPPSVESGENGVSARPIILRTHEKIDPRLQRGFPGALELTTSQPGLYSASPVQVKYAALFDTVVHPAIKKAKKRHHESVPREDLDAIGKNIVDEVIERLATNPEDPNQLNEDTRGKVKRFVKKSFSRGLRKANTQASQKLATPAKNLKFATAGLSGGISLLAGDHRSVTPRLDSNENASLKRADAVPENKDVRMSRQPSPKHLEQQPLSSLQHSPDESSTSFFPPGFDRGRYPAQRRRRGNKYYTPARTSKSTSKLVKDYSTPLTGQTLTAPASDQGTHGWGTSDGKDRVRLLKASASQSTTLSARATQLTALTPTIQNKRTPINEDSALEHLTSTKEPTGMGHDTKAVREFSAPGTRVTQQVPRKRLSEVVSAPEELRPVLRPRPATALDPYLEHLVAVLVTDTSRGASQDDGQKYTITPTDQMQLVSQQNIVKYVGPSSENEKPKLVMIETKVIDPVRQPGRSISSLLRNRELGTTSRGRHVGTISELRQLKSETIAPWKDWKGASGDVVAVAWHPDSNVYAFGAAAHTNVEDIQYNRPCNLLLGDLTSNQIRELPDHRIDRPKPETIPSGPNANQAVYDACDPKVYETVTSIAFSPTGDRMFTASHDCTVKIWDVSGGKYECLSTLRHDAWVTSIEVSEQRPGLFATASKCVKDAVRIYHDSSRFVNFSASRAEIRPEWKIYPECLRWGPNSYTSHLLLAGFQQWEQQGDMLSGGGQLCLWDAYASESIKVTPSSQSVYAAAWHPTHPFFATGGALGNNVIDKINTKTVVRTWDFRTPKRYQVEYECPATDMQDVTFSPSNPNIVTAGCTDGSSYVWDWRWPDQILHRLKHGRPLAELDHTRDREEADTGVMLSLWGPGGSLFYTGSSDGMIKAWDVRRHPNDVLVRNVANFDVGIQSGAFSPDGRNLLVGDAEGGIHILSSAPCGPRSDVKRTDAYIDLLRASDGSGAKLDTGDDNPGTEGIEAARSLIESGQLEYHKELGVGQGLNYRGPYAKYARKEPDESSVGRLRKKFEKKQPISKRGEKRWNIAIPMTSLLYERKQTLDHENDGNNMEPNRLSESKLEATQRSNGGQAVQTISRPGGANAAANNIIGATIGSGKGDEGVEYNMIPEEEMIEENFWWVRLGEEEIEQARAGRVRP